MSWLVLHMAPAPGYQGQTALEQVFGSTPRIVGASIGAYLIGEFINSLVMAKMKVATAGRHLWARALVSTMCGEAVDTLLFYPLAFYGMWPNDVLIKVMIGSYIVKVIWEILATPITYRVVAALKKAENEDHYDRTTNFTPFSLDT